MNYKPTIKIITLLKKIYPLSKDFFLNITASLILTGTMQLFVYPVLAKTLGKQNYGLMLTISGYVNVIILSFGNNLCNSRLLMQEKYSLRKITGDFQLLLIIAVVGSVISFSICNIHLRLEKPLYYSVLIMIALAVCISYYLVSFRLSINYVKNLFTNICECLGLLIGVIFLNRLLSWPWVFSCSYFIGIVYIWFNSDIIHEPLKKTILFSSSLLKTLVLLISGLIGNTTTYLDRFLLHPILGTESVSIYTTSVWFSKSILLIVAPINSVLLSYLIGKKIRFTSKKYLVVNFLLLLIIIFFEICTCTFGKWFTGLLYPSIIQDASPYIAFASFGILINIFNNFLSAIILAYSHIYWQTVFAGLQLMLYFVTGVFFLNKSGLSGLCISVLISNTVMFLIQFFVGLMAVIKENKSDSLNGKTER